MSLQVSVVSLLLLLRTVGLVSSQQSVFYFFYQRPAYPRDCKEALDSCHYQRTSGVYVIKPDGYQEPFEVYCDNTIDSGGWTVILRRHDGSVTYRRDWLDYKLGFGFLSQELWIGNKKLSFLTNQKIYELRIDLIYSDGTSMYALYTFFRISDEFSNYRLTSVGLFNESIGSTNCPTNMEYGTCLCQSSCENFQECLPCPQEEACFCPSGYYLRGADCVTLESCGCFIDGYTIPEGQNYLFPGCVKSCFCISGLLQCNESYQCTSNEVCQLQNNMYQCSCNPAGFVRVGDTCVSICSANQVFGTCACEKSCGDPQVCLSCIQGQRCYCPDGFYLQGQDCVRQEDCGCFMDGTVIPEGQTHIFPGCLKSCSCFNGLRFCDNKYQCTSNEVCQLQNNMYQCICNPAGFSRVGDTCVSICSANQVFGTCACETSCGDPQVCVTCTQGQRCYCPDGFYIQGQNCVQQEDCGCFIDGILIPEGQTHIFPGCLKSCSCFNGQRFCDNNYQCTSNEVCQLQNNMYQCICNPAGFVRVGDTCVSICSANQMYGTCSCETSCGDPQVCVTCTQGQRCYCPDGFYIQGQNCVQQEDCGCFVDGILIPEGQTHIFPGCLKSCSCFNGQHSCDNNYQCSSNEVCQLQNDMYQCICNPAGFVRVGDTCVSICSANQMYGTCSCETSCGDPQVCVTCTQGQRCYCPSGFYLKGQDCVRQEQCNCYTNGILLRNGQTYVNFDCSQQCTCNNDQLSCDPYQCSPNAACIVDNGVRQCICNNGYTGNGQTCTTIITVFRDCYDAYQAGNIANGVYTIIPAGWPGSAFDVFCNMTFGDGGWTVFQRRTDGVTDFYRSWSEYKQGFGTLNEGNDFWLGNEQLHYLTDQKDYILRIDFVDSGDSPFYEEYATFKIGDESNKYQLNYGSFSRGNTGYSYGVLYYNNGKQFSTSDQDNDGCNNHNYADRHKGGWWYWNDSFWCTNCYYSSYCLYFEYGNSGCYSYGTISNLNGDYKGGNGENIFYGNNNGGICNHKFAEMKIRPSSP